MPAPNATQRDHMLRSQILPGHVLDGRILTALTQVDRAAYVPEPLRGAAYVDEELPLGGGRFLMEPLSFARLLSHAAIAPHESVLDVGSGSGYSAAVISKLALKVTALEEESNLMLAGQLLLRDYPNVLTIKGPLADGVASEAPYDVIIVEGAIEFVPQTLADQLAEGGRLLAAHHDAPAQVAAAGLGKLTEYRKLRGRLSRTPLSDAGVPLLAAFRKPAVFTL